MGTRELEIRIGAIALVALCVAVVGGFWLARPSGLPPVGFFVDFPAASGLKVGSKVCIAGVPAGEVLAMEDFDGRFVDAVDRRVHVRTHLSLGASMAELVGQDATFKITTEGVLGERFVEVTPGEGRAPPIQEKQIVQGEQSFQQQDLGWNSNTVSRIVGRLVRKHSVPLKDAGRDIRQIFSTAGSSVDRTSGLIEANSGRVDTLVARVGATKKGLADVTKRVSRVVADLRRGDPVAQMQTAATTLQAGARSVQAEEKKAMERFDDLLAAAESVGPVVSGPLSRIAEAGASIPRNMKALGKTIHSPDTSLGALLADRELLDDVLGMTKDIKRHPWKMLMLWEH